MLLLDGRCPLSDGAEEELVEARVLRCRCSLAGGAEAEAEGPLRSLSASPLSLSLGTLGRVPPTGAFWDLLLSGVLVDPASGHSSASR